MTNRHIFLLGKWFSPWTLQRHRLNLVLPQQENILSTIHSQQVVSSLNNLLTTYSLGRKISPSFMKIDSHFSSFPDIYNPPTRTSEGQGGLVSDAVLLHLFHHNCPSIHSPQQKDFMRILMS